MKKISTLWIVLLLLLIFPVLPVGENQWLYKLLQNDICSEFSQSCKFSITSDYPTSPLISNHFTTLIDSYRYYGIHFEFTSKTNQKFFYQEVFDTSNYKSLFLDLDVVLFNCTDTQACDFYVKMYGNSANSDSFQLNFLGLPDNFRMTVEIKYPSSNINQQISNAKWFSAIKISDDPWLSNYLYERKKEIESINERKQKAKEKAILIMKNLFSVSTFSINFPNNGVIASEIYLSFNFIATVTLAVSTSISGESFFQKEENVIRETRYIKGKIDVDTDGIDFLGDKMNIDNDLIHSFQLFNKQLEDLMFNVEFENDIYSVSLSFNPLLNCIIFTIKFFGDIEMLHNEFEIQIKIVPMNSGLPGTVAEYETSNVNMKQEIAESLENVLIAVGITAAILLGAYFLGPAGTAIGTAIKAALGPAESAITAEIVLAIAQMLQRNLALA